MFQPPPPLVPAPGTLTEEQEDALPPMSMIPITHDTIERAIGIRPMNIEHYRTALTHPNSEFQPHYERLEFLGDSALGYVTARFLYEKFPDKDEGFLTIIRTRLTRSSMLSTFAKELGLDMFIVMAGKSIYRGHHKSRKVLEDVFESLIGAILLDHSMLQARQFILNVYDKFVDWDDLMVDRNYKDILMRHQHQMKRSLPTYVSVRDQETNHFTVTVDLDGHRGVGRDKVKRQAEQKAAKGVLISMGVPVAD
jgi:ribonuclease-3